MTRNSVLLLMSLLWVAGSDLPAAVTIEDARSLVKSGRFVEALREIRELDQEAPNDPNLQFEIGELLQEMAAARAERLSKAAPESPQLHELIGKSLESHQKAAEAVAEYKLAAQANPSMPGIHFLIGNLYWKQRDFDSAIPAFESELKLNPDHSLANLRLGEILLVTDADTPQKAIPFLRKAIADPRTGLEGHRELGKALRLARQYPEALQQFELVVQKKPDDELVHAQLAALYREQGNAEMARKELEIQRQILQRKRDASLKAHQAASNP